MSNRKPQILIHAMAMSAMLATTGALAGEPLRTVHDASRDRVWMLENDALYLHDGAQKRRFELPGWVYVSDAYACPPAVAVDAQGAAIVTSNVVPVLWRIDPAKAQVTSHELTLDADADKDVGFSGLTYAAEQGVFYAVSASYGSLWRIDPLLRRAQKIAVSTPLRDACGLTVDRSKIRRTVMLCAQGRSVYLAPDQRAGYVFAGRCSQDSSL